MFLWLQKRGCVVFFLCLSTLCSAQLYSVSSKKSYARPAPDPALCSVDKGEERAEISVGASGLFSKISDPAGEALTKQAWGATMRAMYFPFGWLGLGAEASFYQSKTDGRALKSLKEERLAAIAKLVYSGDTQPRSYFLFGAGVGRRTSNDFIQGPLTQSAPFYLAGWGFECDLWPNWALGAELDLVYNHAKDLNKLLRKESYWEPIFQLRLIWRL